MPIFRYFVVVGTALLALLFYADAKMTPRGPLAINNEFAGLPKPWQPPATKPSLVATPAPEPDMQSAAVLAAAPQSGKADTAASATRVAKAEPAPKKKHRVARRAPQPYEGPPRYAWRNGGDGLFGGLFGRF